MNKNTLSKIDVNYTYEEWVKLKEAYEKFSEFEKNSFCLKVLFSPASLSYKLPNYPAQLYSLIDRELVLLDDFVVFLSDNKQYLDLEPSILMNLPGIPSEILSDYFKRLLTQFEAAANSFGSRDIPRKVLESEIGDASRASGEEYVTRLKRKEKELRKKIIKIRGIIFQIRMGRPVKPKSDNVDLNKKWEDFYNNGMQTIQSRYSSDANTHLRKRLSALEKFVNEISSEFPYKINSYNLKELNHYYEKRKPLLTAIFGFLTGKVNKRISRKIIRNTQEEIHPKSAVKAVKRLLSNHQ